MRIDIMTLFPELCEGVLDSSIIGRARKNGIIDVRCHNIRDYCADKHRRVDDYPYGGGLGMLMSPEAIAKCFDAVCRQTEKRPKLIYMSPTGQVFNERMAEQLKQEENICLLCGHYEGIDQRLLDEMVDMEISIGDYVLTGGELPALIITDAVARLVPGVLSEEGCFEEESHMNGLLEYPQYTRPPEWRGRQVPEVLLSGHEANIKKWRHEQALLRTAERRPDMLDWSNLTKKDREILKNSGFEPPKGN